MTATISLIHFDPKLVNLAGRLRELPYSAWKRITPDSVGIPLNRLKPILYNRIRNLHRPELESFLDLLKCKEEEFFNPEHQFVDFRTKQEKEEDINSFTE